MATLNKRSKSDAERADKGRFRAGHHMGRPKGSRGKLSQQQLRDAREFFLPHLETAGAIIAKHFELHSDAPDCATCRHYVTLVVEYVFGKPPQRVDVELVEARAEAERIAEELGLSGDEKRAAVAEVEALLRVGR